MTAELSCSRCKTLSAALEADPPLPKELAQLVRDRVCASCWREWQDMEVNVINELRLNFMDPAAQDILHAKMREFLELEASAD